MVLPRSAQGPNTQKTPRKQVAVEAGQTMENSENSLCVDCSIGRVPFKTYLYIVKTPAVKPCIVYIIDLPDSVGSKELRAERLLVYFTPIAVDLVNTGYQP